MTTNAAYALKTASSIKEDDHQDLFTELAVLECEVIVVKEYHYHKTCRCAILKKIPEQSTMKANAFLKLKEYVQINVIKKGQIIKMNTLIDIYKTIIAEYNKEEVGLKSQNMKQRLQNHFGEKLSLWAPPGIGGIIYSKETPCKEKSFYDIVNTSLLQDCTEIIREEILKFKDPFSSWPLTEKELLSHGVSLPPLLEQLV